MKFIFWSISFLLVVTTISSCINQNGSNSQLEKIKTSTPTPVQENDLQQPKTIWNEKILEELREKLKYAIAYKVYLKDPTISPPFYNDTKPLTFFAYKYSPNEDSPLIILDDYKIFLKELNVSPPFYKDPKPLTVYAYKFDEFINIFIYDRESPIVYKGAQTFDNSGKMVAEARFLIFIEENKKIQGFEIEEFNYESDGKLIFKGKSLFDTGGFKIKETETIGNKARDYYFIWPIGY